MPIDEATKILKYLNNTKLPSPVDYEAILRFFEDYNKFLEEFGEFLLITKQE